MLHDSDINTTRGPILTVYTIKKKPGVAQKLLKFSSTSLAGTPHTTQKKHCIPSTHICCVLTMCQAQRKERKKKRVCAQATHDPAQKQCGGDRHGDAGIHKGRRKRG